MTDPLLLETAERVFADTCSAAQIEDAEARGFAPRVWDAVAQIGFPRLGLPEEAGGVGGTMGDALAVLKLAGRHAAPIPLAETGLLAGWLLAGAGLDLGVGPLGVAPDCGEISLSAARVSGCARRVAWGRAVERVVVLIETGGGAQVAALATRSARLEPHSNLAGEPRDTLYFDSVVPEAIAPAAAGIDALALRRRGARTRAGLMGGALDAMSALTTSYARERRQFGRAIAEFQAVQQHLVTVAQQAALVGAASTGAASAAERGDAAFEIAAAKLLANRAAQSATRAAHQAHGAMGMTREYPLHALSRRLWAWRSEYGDERFWSLQLGRALALGGAERLYPAIAGGSSAFAG
jgi:acyl-CoA dehydrogenase